MSLRILYTKRMSKVYSIVTTCNSYFTWTIQLKWLRFISGFKSATFNDSDLSKIDVTKEIFSLLELTPLFFFIFHWIQSFRWFIRILFSITSNLKIFEIQIFAYYPESAELSDSTTDRSALRRHSGRKNKCFHKKPTKQGFSKKPSWVIVLSWFFTSPERTIEFE